MKIFISWSGDLSHKVALVFREWLPSVIQTIEPYVSSEDIDKGTRWSTDIAKELAESSYGILCVTPDNIDAPWLNFEAGALSKAFDKSHVSPFLFNMKRSEIKEGPTLQFQSTLFEKNDIKKLIQGINKVDDDSKLEESRLDKAFDVWWPNLESKLNSLKDNAGQPETPEKVEDDTTSEILEEVLELVRNQHKLLNSPESILPANYLYNLMKALPFLWSPPTSPSAIIPLIDLDHIYSNLGNLRKFFKDSIFNEEMLNIAENDAESIYNTLMNSVELIEVSLSPISKSFTEVLSMHKPRKSKPISFL